MKKYEFYRNERIKKVKLLCSPDQNFKAAEKSLNLKIGNIIKLSLNFSSTETRKKMFKLDTFKTKSFWAGVAMVLWGAYQLSQGEPGAENKIMVGIGLIVGRDALSKIENK